MILVVVVCESNTSPVYRIYRVRFFHIEYTDYKISKYKYVINKVIYI